MTRMPYLVTALLFISTVARANHVDHHQSNGRAHICEKVHPSDNGPSRGYRRGGFRCKCPVGWKGDDCDEDINECDSNPCKNGGVCNNSEGSFTCTCDVGWTGAVCEQDINECLGTNVCKALSNCVNTPGSYMCICYKCLSEEKCSLDISVKSVLIETSDDVFVITQNVYLENRGGTTILPFIKLSTKYVVISFEPFFSGFNSLLAVAATEDDTDVSLTFTMKRNKTLNIDGNTFYDGDVFHFRLARFETYQIEHITDLTGTFIESSVPIAAFSGNVFNSFNGNADNLIEQLPPYDSVDKTYIVPPHSPDRDTLIRITATENAIVNYAIGDVSEVRSLNKFESFDTKILSNQTCFIESKTPMLVTSYGLHAKRRLFAAPSMTIVPGFNQYIDYYKIVVPPGYTDNYLSIMIKKSSKDLLLINGTYINASDIVFEENVSDGNVIYNVRSIRVVEGELTASTVNRERFGLMFDGAKKFAASGFSGNSVLP